MKHVMIIGTELSERQLAARLNMIDSVRVTVITTPGDRMTMEGSPTINSWEDLPNYIEDEQINQIYLAMPGLEKEKKQQLMQWCRERKCELIVEPSYYEAESRKASILQTAHDHMEELLGRKLVKLPFDIRPLVQGKRILVTGASGTIGSQICRVLAEYQPSKLILVDIAENDSLRVMKEITPAVENAVLAIGSVTNEKFVRSVFAAHCPQIIFHAAAHKHVPLMETNLSQCVENNVFGTYCCAEAAMQCGAESFVLISTDKAAAPVSVMGKAKRICEIMMRLFDKRGNTSFCSVRFGNVIGSSGSVLQAFAEQIACGGPVMLTDRGMTRFFMTASEAAQLVISAAFMEKKAHMYMLDMGKPVSIAALARRLLNLVGRQDISIISTGRRRGEKLTETLCAPGEQLCSSGYAHIFSIQENTQFQEKKWFLRLEKLRETLFQDEKAAIRLIQQLIMEENR